MLKADIDSIEWENKISLNNVRFTLDSGIVLSVLGENGIGKSTLLKLLSGFYDLSDKKLKGTIILDNEHLYSGEKLTNNNGFYKSIRYLFQDAVNVFDPLKKLGYYFRNFEDGEGTVEEWFEFFRLPPYRNLAKLYPYECSVGMLQRLSIIITLIGNPTIVFMDEPTSALDSQVTDLLLDKIVDIKKTKGTSFVIVNQDIEFTKAVSDRIGFLTREGLFIFDSLNDLMHKRELSDSDYFKALKWEIGDDID